MDSAAIIAEMRRWYDSVDPTDLDLVEHMEAWLSEHAQPQTMAVEIRPYEKGWGLWIDGKWLYGHPSGFCDANSVAHIIAMRCRERGLNVTYELVGDQPALHLKPAQEPTDGERLRCAHCGAPRWIHGRSDYWCPEFKPAMSARTEDQG
jgi:hypothetical protein